MNIKELSIDKLNPAAYNPRKDLTPDDPEYQAIKRSITEFGLVDPVIWNQATGNIVGGHQRFKVLKEMGHKKCMVSVVDLTEKAEAVLNVVLNKASGEWDYPKLKDLIAEIDTGEFDIELTGFNQNEMDQLFSWGTYGDPQDDWKGMPEFNQEDKKFYRVLKVYLETEQDFLDFAEKIKQDISKKARYIYHPKQIIDYTLSKKLLNTDES